MPFRVMARTVLQLGAELISSDGVAFYELIKNAFDADSPRVDIDVNVRLPHDRYRTHVDSVLNERKVRRTQPALERAVKEIAEAAAQDIDLDAPKATELKASIEQSNDWDQLLVALDAATSIMFQDTGTGMSGEELDQDAAHTEGATTSTVQSVQESQEGTGETSGGTPAELGGVSRMEGDLGDGSRTTAEPEHGSDQ